MIQVHFETTVADVQALQAFALSSVQGFANKASLGFSWRSVLMGVPFGLALFIGLEFLDVSVHIPTAVLAAGIFAMYFLVVGRQVAGATAPAERGAFLGPRQTSIDEGGVREESRNHEHQSTWGGILSVGETPSHIFLMIDRFGGYIVPKRAFADPAQLGAFLAFARTRVGTSHEQIPTGPGTSSTHAGTR